MRDRQFKELWSIRFLNILNLEKESSLFYARLLAKDQAVLEKTGTKALLEQMVNDRKERVQIARELVHLVNRKTISEESNTSEPRNKET